jgi:hypothetical protein
MVQLIEKPRIFAANSLQFFRNTENHNSTNSGKFGEEVAVDA